MVKKLTPLICLVGLCWAVFVVNNLLWGGRLSYYGIVPRQPGSLPAVLWAPFLHGSFKHLAANTAPLVILGAIVCMRKPSEFISVVCAGILLSGAFIWIFARPASHIGASGIVFCLFGYIASLAVFRRTLGSLLISVICLIVYGGMLKGLLPTSQPISWEGHIAGLAAGILIAWIWPGSTKPRASS